MIVDVDFLTTYFIKKSKFTPIEIGEQTDATTGGSSRQVKKWESGLTRGKSNQIANTKWESGATRGKANPIGNTKWVSGRTIGKTGGSDFA